MKNSWRALNALMVGFVLSACTSQGSIPQPQQIPSSSPGVPLSGHSLCGDHVVINFVTDKEMYSGVAAAASDSRVRRVYTETKKQAFEHFKEIFADQPDLKDQASADQLPAGLRVMPVEGVDVRALADDLRSRYPQATSVEAFVRPATVPGAPECPADGEWPPR